MRKLFVDFSCEQGVVKPMHAVNNGPVHKWGESQRVSNLESYKAAGIPYSRNHDASFFSTYGGNHTVDVDFIFTDFDADPYDEASYDFACTDELVRVTELAGAKTFYRLGSKIEHEVKKYNTLPPKDFKKWAIICEHIIRHYTEGWANGFYYDMEYWEVWNEPDLAWTQPDYSIGRSTWAASLPVFCDLFNTAVGHLKEKFPHLKIGGPAVCYFKDDWMEQFFAGINVVPDFFSWHCYTSNVETVLNDVMKYRNFLDSHGMQNTESILNEWNYLQGWAADEFVYTIDSIMGLKGAAYTAAVMCACQNAPLDMLMYYDARPCAFNGMWSAYTYRELKGYYPFCAFNTLYKLGQNVKAESDGPNLYICAAKNQTEQAILITHFDNDDNSGDAEFTLSVNGLSEGKLAEYYILDEEHNLDLIDTKPFKNEETIKLPHNAMMLIKIR